MATRRQFLQQLSAYTVADSVLPALATAADGNGGGKGKMPIRHVQICVNENRSFNHYYGYAPFAGSYGVPAGYSQPASDGFKVEPYPLYVPTTPNPTHDWATIHAEYDNGKMDGFYTANGLSAMPYYTQASLPFYYSLFNNFTLCAGYHCSMLGPTYPNRLYTVGGTSGGITTNNLTPGIARLAHHSRPVGGPRHHVESLRH